MDAHELIAERITVNPSICFGKPVITGTRIWVSVILDCLAEGMSHAEVLESYPYLSLLDIQAALAYGAERVRQVTGSVNAPV